MMKRSSVDFYISASACIWGCLLILLAPLDLVCAFMTAAAIHELSHILTLRCFRIPIHKISIGIGGAVIQTPPVPPHQEFICTAAGPAGSFLCLAFFRRFPLVTLCGLIQGIYNLLPVYPMDGGRLFHIFSRFVCPRQADFLCAIAKVSTVALVTVSSFSLYFRTSDSLFLLFALYFPLHICLKRKIPCKAERY